MPADKLSKAEKRFNTALIMFYIALTMFAITAVAFILSR